ncbi:MAG: hypothetical protein IKP58_14880 [Victivallales bacterium]|nr:hypothetical protein [Victivallales bacterium]
MIFDDFFQNNKIQSSFLRFVIVGRGTQDGFPRNQSAVQRPMKIIELAPHPKQKGD